MSLDMPTTTKDLKHVAIAQAAAVQNTWYVLMNDQDNKEKEIYIVGVNMATNIETLELELTIDDALTAIKFTQAAAIVGVTYVAVLQHDGTITADQTAPRLLLCFGKAPLKCRRFLARVRKTTVVGAGTLGGHVWYSKKA